MISQLNRTSDNFGNPQFTSQNVHKGNALGKVNGESARGKSCWCKGRLKILSRVEPASYQSCPCSCLPSPTLPNLWARLSGRSDNGEQRKSRDQSPVGRTAHSYGDCCVAGCASAISRRSAFTAQDTAPQTEIQLEIQLEIELEIAPCSLFCARPTLAVTYILAYIETRLQHVSDNQPLLLLLGVSVYLLCGVATLSLIWFLI